MSMRRFGNNATTRNIVDLILVIAILVLLTIAAPVIRGDCNYDGKFSCELHVLMMTIENSSILELKLTSFHDFEYQLQSSM